jgi:type IV pilus assembly protein PilA
MQKRRDGFTLIELLIVIVIIGILAAIAIPKFSATREKAYMKAMESDLRNLAAQQEIFYSDPENAYAYYDGSIAEGEYNEDLQFSSSAGVSITITTTDTGFFAVAEHLALAGASCALAIGDETLVAAPAVSVGVIGCEQGGE